MVQDTDLKVFKMDDCSWVCARSKAEAIKWYRNNCDECYKEDPEECNLENTTLVEVTLGDVVDTINSAEDREDITIVKLKSGLFKKETFAQAIKMMTKNRSSDNSVPFEIATTEI